MTRCSLALLAGAAALALGACGGASTTSSSIANVTVTPTKAQPGQERFSAPGIALRFDYPAAFKPLELTQTRLAGHTSGATHAGIGLGPYDLVAVSRYPGLPLAVTAGNLGQAKAEFDSLMSRVFGHAMVSRTTTPAGHAALLWPRSALPGKPATTMQPANVFVGHDEYELECRATPEHLRAVQAACAEMLRTLTTA